MANADCLACTAVTSSANNTRQMPTRTSCRPFIADEGAGFRETVAAAGGR